MLSSSHCAIGKRVDLAAGTKETTERVRGAGATEVSCKKVASPEHGQRSTEGKAGDKDAEVICGWG